MRAFVLVIFAVLALGLSLELTGAMDSEKYRVVFFKQVTAFFAETTQ